MGSTLCEQGNNFGRTNFGKNIRTNFGNILIIGGSNFGWAHRVGICPGVEGIYRPGPYFP
jgi:hypothetical protein